MKLSKETLEILKNFASISPQLLIRPGSELKTMTVQKNVMAQATVKEKFPVEAPIYDLNNFLATISLFEDPDFDWDEKNVEITDKSGAVAIYRYAAKETLVAVTDKKVVLPSVDAEFDLSKTDLSAALKAASVMGLPNLALQGSESEVSIVALRNEDDSAHGWAKVIGATDETFNIIFRAELLKFLPRDYKIEVSKRMITKFQSTAGDLVYFVAAETGSTFK